MFSVDNFYAILHQNLIQPTGLSTWFFYPFGTRDKLIRYLPIARGTGPIKNAAHVMFAFDQEPVYDMVDWQQYDQQPSSWSNKICRIFANSEHSAAKNKICNDRSALDWYFFYHGFAALDWYRDSAYLDQVAPVQKVFCSLNHLCRDLRSYRLALTARLLDLGIEGHGDISLHCQGKDCHHEINQPHTRLSSGDKKLITKHLVSNQRLPFVVDTTEVDSNFSAHFSVDHFGLWQRSLFHLVNETVFYDSKLHLTEKVFKPIVAARPFILVAAAGNLAYLRSYGFETFSKWIDESYDEVSDPDQRLDLIAAEIARLCRKSPYELVAMYDEMRPVLAYNKQHFFGQFRKIIVSELVDNFDLCVRMWNNGRVDDKRLMPHQDLESVKQLLLAC